MLVLSALPSISSSVLYIDFEGMTIFLSWKIGPKALIQVFLFSIALMAFSDRVARGADPDFRFFDFGIRFSFSVR